MRLPKATALLATAWASIGGSAEGPRQPMLQPAIALPVEGRFPSLAGATAWLNSEPLSPKSLKGKVVLVEFGTYTCINWIRTVPYVREWARKYKEHGLVVITVHTPEFSFEGDLKNVRTNLQSQDVTMPVAVDSNGDIWNAFGNRYWPAMYFIDAQGRIRHRTHGEGGYQKSEQVLRQLIVEAGYTVPELGDVAIVGRGAEASADWSNLGSPETYVGYGRATRLASPERPRLERSRTYTTPQGLDVNEWALAGDWTLTRESAISGRSNARIAYQFRSRDLHLVMGRAPTGAPIHFRVLIDGRPPLHAHGEDVDAQGYGVVDQPRMYQLIRQSMPIKPTRFEIEFLDAGAEVYAFTFG